jgi:LmbE family N-acetylglucosaminyl deacetylase
MAKTFFHQKRKRVKKCLTSTIVGMISVWASILCRIVLATCTPGEKQGADEKWGNSKSGRKSEQAGRRREKAERAAQIETRTQHRNWLSLACPGACDLHPV